MSVCPRCGATFCCAPVDGPKDQPCWCTTLPSLPGADPAAGRCFCPDCLKSLIAASARQAGSDSNSDK